MKLHIAPPDTPMAAAVLEFAQYAANMLDRTQFIVMERRTWERLMPSAPAQVIEPAAVIRDVANLESSEAKHGN